MMNLKGNIDKKVEGLLSQMTLEEKVAQMQQLSANATPAEIFKDFKEKGEIGSYLHVLGKDTGEYLESDNPLGPFKPFSEQPQTPCEWECLDGTLWIEDGKPYMVFCHEWQQCENGEMCAVQLSEDLKEPIGEPFLLFKASDNPYVSSFVGVKFQNCRVTDGPFLFRENGKLKMIWSSFSDGKYSVLEATADCLRGKWEHFKPRFDFDGGHAMIFETFDHKKYVSLHQPNVSPYERAAFLPYKENDCL